MSAHKVIFLLPFTVARPVLPSKLRKTCVHSSLKYLHRPVYNFGKGLQSLTLLYLKQSRTIRHLKTTLNTSNAYYMTSLFYLNRNVHYLSNMYADSHSQQEKYVGQAFNWVQGTLQYTQISNSEQSRSSDNMHGNNNYNNYKHAIMLCVSSLNKHCDTDISAA